MRAKRAMEAADRQARDKEKREAEQRVNMHFVIVFNDK